MNMRCEQALIAPREGTELVGTRAPVLEVGRNCWRTETAERVAPLIDVEDYFRTAREAISKASRSIILLGWTFDPRTLLLPSSDDLEIPLAIGELLTFVAKRKPELDVRVLIWNMPLLYSVRNQWFPQRAARWFDDATVKFRVDPCEHTGASYHQKLLVVDDAIAFCGGGDFTAGRWDSIEHIDDDPRRRDPSGRRYSARHEVMMAVAGPAAAALGDLARERWFDATGERVERPPPAQVSAVWPESLCYALKDLPVSISRTAAAAGEREPVRENEALLLDSIAAARRLIFIENQYFTAPAIGAALAKRLEEREGPEVVLVCTHRSPGFLDGLCMDAARDRLIARLREADRYDRFRAYSPYTAGGNGIIVHAKVMIIDDDLLRVGSCNIANRSMGFDSECDVSISFPDSDAGAKGRAATARFRHSLIGHYLGTLPEQVEESEEREGSLREAIEALDRGASRRLPPLIPRRLGLLGRMIAHYHLGDPEGAEDAWRPWRRRTSGELFEAAFSSRRSTTNGR